MTKRIKYMNLFGGIYVIHIAVEKLVTECHFLEQFKKFILRFFNEDNLHPIDLSLFYPEIIPK